MERKEFLLKCQKCAFLQNGIMNIKKSVPEEDKVIFDGIKYYPKAYMLEFSSVGTPQHIAVLHSLDANSETYCDLERVEENV